MIAVSHPGKNGDALAALSTVKALCTRHQTQADFYTSAHCAALKPLLEYQPFIHELIVPENYVIERGDIGIQPWQMPIDETRYEAVYQLGFRGVPDRPLDQFIARSVGIEPEFFTLQAPPSPLVGRDYWTMGMRGSEFFEVLYREFVARAPLEVVVVGNEYLGFGLDATKGTFLEMASIIGGSRGFVGLSAPLAVANYFPIPKVMIHDGVHWDTRHLIRSPLNHYLINPSVEDIFACLEVDHALLKND